MRRRPPRQLPLPFDRDVPAITLPAQIAQDLVNALADLLATVLDADDEERDDAHQDHR